MSTLDTFYVHLPSDTINPSHPNKSNSFRIALPKPLRLNGVWLCGLSSIIYPRSYAAIGTTGPQEIQIAIREPHYDDRGHTEYVTVEIPSGSYTTAQGLAHAINAAIDRKVEEIRQREPKLLRKRAVDDEVTPGNAQLYAKRPTPEDVSSGQISITRDEQPSGAAVVKYFDKEGVLRWQELDPPLVRRSRDANDDAQMELLHVQRIGFEIRQLLMNDRGDFLIKRSNSVPSSGGFQFVGGPRKYPDPQQWTRIKSFVRKKSGDQIELFTNINNDLYFHWDNGDVYYRDPGAPTAPLSSIEMPPLVSALPQQDTTTQKPPTASTTPPAPPPPPPVTAGPTPPPPTPGPTPAPSSAGERDEVKQQVLSDSDLEKRREQKEGVEKKRVEEDKPTQQKPLSDQEISIEPAKAVAKESPQKPLSDEELGIKPAKAVAKESPQVEKKIGRILTGERIEEADERNIPLSDKLAEFRLRYNEDINRFVLGFGHWTRYCRFSPQLGYALGFDAHWFAFPFTRQI
jgi:hypothetical protein